MSLGFTPYFPWAIAIVLLLMMGWGIRQATKKIEREESETRQLRETLHSDIREILREAHELPRLMARQFGLRRDMDGWSQPLNEADEAITRFRVSLDSLSQGGEGSLIVRDRLQMESQNASYCVTTAWNTIRAGDDRPWHITIPQFHFDQNNEPFDPVRNAGALHEHRNNLTRLEEAMRVIHQKAQDHTAAHGAAMNEVQQLVERLRGQ